MSSRSKKYCNKFGKTGIVLNKKSIVMQNKLDRISDNMEEIEEYRELKELLMRCLEVDPKKRITAKEALQHKFFQIIY